MTAARAARLRVVETDRQQAERLRASRLSAEAALSRAREEEAAFVRSYSDRHGLLVRLRSADQVLRDIEAREGQSA